MTASRKTMVAFGLALGLTLMPDVAPAQPSPTYRGRFYEDRFITRKPVRGYSGWGSGHLSDYYCDYQRLPIRTCTKRGCRVVAWEFYQYCY